MTGQSNAISGTTGSSKKLIVGLSCLLVAQLGLCALLMLRQKTYSSVETAALVQCNPDTINKISIRMGKASSHSDTISLKRTNKGWILPELNDYPADQLMVNKIIRVVRDWRKGVPVTTTADAFDRFKISDDNYMQLITVEDDHHVVNKIYLGIVPNFKSMYARMDKSNDVYCVEMPEYFLLPGSDTEIIDKKLREPILMSLSEISAGDDVLTQNTQGGWVLKSGSSEYKLSSIAVKTGLQKSFDVSIIALLGTKEKPEFNQDKPELVTTIKLKSGEKLTYTLSKMKDQSSSVLKISDQPNYMELNNSEADKLKNLLPLMKQEDDKRRRLVEQNKAIQEMAVKAAAAQKKAASESAK